MTSRGARIQILFCEGTDDRLLLVDCVLLDRFGAVPAGQPFTMLVRVAAGTDATRDVFEVWTATGAPVTLCVEIDLQGPRVRFSGGGAALTLDVVAASPLRSS